MTDVKVEEKERVACKKDLVYLRIDGDFANKKMKLLFTIAMTIRSGYESGSPVR